MRVGQGIDVHPFSDDPARGRWSSAASAFSDTGGLGGHSDADAVAHALADAVLGAAGLGDLGDHFPDNDPAWAGADSIELLRSVVAAAADAGWRPVNGDCTVVLEAPKLAPHRAAMAARLERRAGRTGQRQGDAARRLWAPSVVVRAFCVSPWSCWKTA